MKAEMLSSVLIEFVETLCLKISCLGKKKKKVYIQVAKFLRFFSITNQQTTQLSEFCIHIPQDKKQNNQKW